MYAIYARQSVDRPDSISIESQIEFCKYEVRGEEYREYTDKGYSGKNTDRPQFQQLVTDIRKGEITKVVVYKLDRISRSILDFSNMMVMFQKYGVEFISSTEKFDTGSPMGRAMLNICIVFAQLERETIQKRVADNYLARSQRGFYMGGRISYGFQLMETTIQGKKTSMYVIQPEEAEQVKLIYEMYADPHVSYGDIVRQFQQIGVTKLRGKDKLWDRVRIAETLKNPAYVQADYSVYEFFKKLGAEIVNDPDDFIGTNGCYYYRGQNAANSKRVDPSGHVLVLAPHEGFVPSDLWLKCRVKGMNNKQIQTGRKVVHNWLAGKIKCLQCGYAMARREHPKGYSTHYVCTRKLYAKVCQDSKRINAKWLEPAVLVQMREKLKEFQTLQGRQEVQPDPKGTALRIQLAQIEDEIEKLVRNVAGADDVLLSYLNKRVRELDKERQETLDALSQLTIEAETLTPDDVNRITGYMDRWEELTVDEKRLVCDSLIRVIRANTGTIEIEWKF